MAPFDPSNFIEVFTSYNLASWPVQTGLIGLAVAAALAALMRPAWSGRAVGMALATLWLWAGAVYHIAFSTRVTPAAYLFGVLFLLQGVLISRAALQGHLRFAVRPDVRGLAGGILILWALAGYPATAILAGHAFPAAPTFGAPCPITIFTFGMLLWTDRRPPAWLLAVPFTWAAVGSSVVWLFGMVEDIALPLAAVTAGMLLLRGPRSPADAPAAELPRTPGLVRSTPRTAVVHAALTPRNAA